MDRPGSNLAAADRRLLDDLDRGFAGAQRRAGRHLLCAPGCNACCHGPFAITRLDRWRLERGLETLRREDPTTADAIAADARHAIETLSEGFPGDVASGRLNSGESELDRFFETHAALACPVLDRDAGTCRLWDARPVSCRTYGPPLEFEGAPAPHCELCFKGASRDTIEACRWAPDPRGLEQALLRDAGVEVGQDWETLIAHAVAGPAKREGAG